MKIENEIEIYNQDEYGLITNGKAQDSTIPTTAGRFAQGCSILGVNGKVYRNAGTVAVPSWQDTDEISTSEIADGAVTLAKMANMATASVIYRKTAATGVPEVNSVATLKTDLGLTGTNSGDQTITLTGDVTGSGTGTFATTIANGAVTQAKLAPGAGGSGVQESYLRNADETETPIFTAVGDTICTVVVKVDTTFSDGFDGAQPEFSLNVGGALYGNVFMPDTVLVNKASGTTFVYGVRVPAGDSIQITAVPAIPSTYYDDDNGAITVTVVAVPELA